MFWPGITQFNDGCFNSWIEEMLIWINLVVCCKRNGFKREISNIFSSKLDASFYLCVLFHFLLTMLYCLCLIS